MVTDSFTSCTDETCDTDDFNSQHSLQQRPILLSWRLFASTVTFRRLNVRILVPKKKKRKKFFRLTTHPREIHTSLFGGIFVAKEIKLSIDVAKLRLHKAQR